MDYQFKILILGEGAVGKTSLLERYLNNSFGDTRMTVGFGFGDKKVTINGKAVALTIFDFGGQERFSFMFDGMIMGSQAYIYVFDMTKRTSFTLLPKWFERVKCNYNHDNCLEYFVGNKYDLVEKCIDPVHDNPIECFGKDPSKCRFYRTSAKTGDNVDVMFTDLAHQLVEASKVRKQVLIGE